MWSLPRGNRGRCHTFDGGEGFQVADAAVGELLFQYGQAERIDRTDGGNVLPGVEGGELRIAIGLPRFLFWAVFGDTQILHKFFQVQF